MCCRNSGSPGNERKDAEPKFGFWALIGVTGAVAILHWAEQGEPTWTMGAVIFCGGVLAFLERILAALRQLNR